MVDLLALARKPAEAKRLGEIIAVLAKYGLADKLRHIPVSFLRNMVASAAVQAAADAPFGERLRLAFTELGTTFIKLGQILSTRADMVGPAIAEELSLLQSGTPADAPEKALETIEQEFGKPASELFASFDAAAFKSASIGQVHKATLHSGEAVVVKVQHQGIQEDVERDLDILMALAELWEEHITESRSYRPRMTVREFRRTMLKELDFEWEKRHLEQFSRNFDKETKIHIPRVYGDLSGNTVLTMEFVDGIPGSQTEAMVAAGLDLDDIARTTADTFVTMIFRDGFYHADPHPGNIMVMPETGVVTLLDCGMVGHIDQDLRELFGDLLIMLMQGDASGLADTLLRAGQAPIGVDRLAFRTAVGDLITDYGSQHIADMDLSAALAQLNTILREHGVRLPASVALLLKTMIMLQGTVGALSPNFGLLEVITPFKERLLRERMDPRRLLKRLYKSARDLDRLATTGPRSLIDVLEHLQYGTLRVNHDVPHLEKTVNHLVTGLVVASLFLGSCILASVSGHWLGVVTGILGWLLAVALGGRLLWRIAREERHPDEM